MRNVKWTWSELSDFLTWPPWIYLSKGKLRDVIVFYGLIWFWCSMIDSKAIRFLVDLLCYDKNSSFCACWNIDVVESKSVLVMKVLYCY